MQYTLNLELGGFDDAEKKLDSLLSKIGNLGNGKIPFEQWLSAGSETESAGEKIGESIKKGIKKNLTGNWLGLTGQFGQVIQKAQKDLDKFWNDAVKNGAKIVNNQKGYGMADLPKMGFTTPKFPDFKFQEFKPQLDKLKIGIAGIATLFNPFVGARLLSDLIPKEHMSGGKGVTGAIFGAAGAAGYGEIFVVVKLLETSFKLLAKAVMNTVEAYETARKLYAKALTSGLGLNFTVKRGMIADILGVSETEVLRFGQAMNYLNPKLAFASETLAKTAVPLTGVGWEFKILSENIKALWAQMAEGLTPSIKALLIEFNDFLVTLGRTGNIEFLGQVLSKLFQSLVNTIGALELIGATFAAQFSIIRDSLTLLIESTINLIAKIPGAGKLGIHSFDTSVVEKHMAGTISALGTQYKDYFSNLLGANAKNVPPPMAQMKQLIGSDWEKHGLNIAGGQSTNDLIKKGNGYLKTIADHITQNKNIPRAGQFGMSPFVSNP